MDDPCDALLTPKLWPLGVMLPCGSSQESPQWLNVSLAQVTQKFMKVYELFWMKIPIAFENGHETTSVWQHFLFQ